MSDASRASAPHAPQLDSLPDELLIQIFGALADVGGVLEEEDDPLRLAGLPYRQPDVEVIPCPGLRGYPFLAQVCRKWRHLLGTPMAQSLVWRSVVVDLGHELVTSIHTPLRWSNQRPTAAEYTAAFQATRISADKVSRFLVGVAPHVRCLTLSNSESFQADDGEHVSLADKHDLGPYHVGFVLGKMDANLTELRLYRCSDLATAVGGGLLSLVTLVPALRRLAVEGLRGPLPAVQAAGLGALRQLEALVFTGEEHRGNWAVGLDAVPSTWSRLTSLTRLELRCQPQLMSLPAWLPSLPRLQLLDVSGCYGLGSLAPLAAMTRLQVLVLQNLQMGLALPSVAEAAAAEASGQPPPRRVLPDLTPLAGALRTLSLANNRFGRPPEWLHKMTRLEHLDMSFNRDLHLPAPLTALAALPHLSLLDFREVHITKDKAYWCEAKCNTMSNLSRLAKALKRRCPQPRLLTDL